MNSLIHRNNSQPNNEPIWHASFTSFHNSLTASCACIRTTSITWTSRTAQSRFTPVHTGYHSCNETCSNASLIISSRMVSWNAVCASQWASGTFIIPKKDGRVRWISDFHALNKCIKRKTYPLPHISEILSMRTGYAYFSKLDISMAYDTFELDDESKALCTINTPCGLYCYRVLPLGIAQSPDFCQETMKHISPGHHGCRHLHRRHWMFWQVLGTAFGVLEQVMTHLQDNSFSVNPCKCEWAVQETDFLGYWLTPNGLNPWHKKIDAILRLQHPRTVKDLRSFIGAVTYYCTMFPKRAHVLTPLTALTSQKSGNVAWSAECQQAFDTIKAILSSDMLLRYPNHNKPFHIYTEASDLQLGASIVQDD